MNKIALCTALSFLIASPVRGSGLEGVWSAFVDYEVPARVELRVAHAEGEQWRATIGAAELPGVLRDGGSIDFTTQEGGTLRLYPRKAQAPAAFWIQRRLETAGARYANPVDLIARGAGVWHGVARPRPESFHLDLTIRDSDEGLIATLRNPERNFGIYMGKMQVTVAPDGSVSFQRDEAEAPLTGRRQGDRMVLQVGVLGDREAIFTRHRTPRAGYAARPEAVTALTPPQARDDGWAVAAPQGRGIDPAPLLALTQRIASQDPSNLYAESVHSMVLAQGGVVVLEESFFGHDPSLPHDTRSAGKSFSSTLVAMAIQQGYEISPGTRLGAVFPRDIADEDERKRAIELRHLMSMSAGLDCDDDNAESPGNEDVLQSQQAQPDWIRYTLGLPMVRAPGEKAVYCSAGVNLASAVVQRITGRWLPEFFDANFAKPLGIRHYHMNLMPTGDLYVGGGIFMAARDLAKFGQLFLDDGDWNGTRLLPKGWAAQAFAGVASIHEPEDYGLNWWRKAFEVQGRRIETFYASGNGGQLVFVLPQLDAVFVVQAGNYSNYGTWRRFRDEHLADYVIPALLARGAPAR